MPVIRGIILGKFPDYRARQEGSKKYDNDYVATILVILTVSLTLSATIYIYTTIVSVASWHFKAKTLGERDKDEGRQGRDTTLVSLGGINFVALDYKTYADEIKKEFHSYLFHRKG